MESIVITFCYLKNLSIPKRCFANKSMFESQDDTLHKQNTFSDSANEAYGCVVYLRKISNGVLSTSFVNGKNNVVLGH